MLLWLLSSLASASSLSDSLSATLEKAQAEFAQLDEQPHYTAVTVTGNERVFIRATRGAVSDDVYSRERELDIDLRVGTPELDSTHQLRGFSTVEGSSRSSITLPLDRDDAIPRILWQALDKQYRDQAKRVKLIRANQDVLVAEEATANDWEVRPPSQYGVSVPSLEVDRDAWTDALLTVSRVLDENPDTHNSRVYLDAQRTTRTFVDTDGALIEDGRVHGRIVITASARADDGDMVDVFRSLDVHQLDRLPDEQTLLSWAQQANERLTALKSAPRGEPYSGPVLLQGRATGVFFHEVMGHRVEGHRQKRESEGKTFADFVNKPILPNFIDVIDDPTIEQMAGEDLNGHYLYDDEGTPAQLAELVKDGVFKGFLTHRSPIPGFETSNGHGRRSPGRLPLARMGNTIVKNTQPQTMDSLRRQLVDELNKQGLEYGYMVEAIDGGFTMTGRFMPNAFNVRASASWRVFADGRPDELVRGIDLVGTPLVAFNNLIGAGDTYQVFNGVCGAESGWVPVSAVAPATLYSRLEFQLKEKGQQRPPILEKPSPIQSSADAEVSQ